MTVRTAEGYAVVSRVTHAVGGYVASLLTGTDPLVAVAGALLPDLDFHLGALHRRLLHNVWSAVLAWYAGGTALAVGVVSHLVLDSLTPRGVNWFWPLPFPRVRGPVHTGSFTDCALAGALAVLAIVLM